MEKSFRILAVNGLHARPATILVNEAVKYSSDLSIGMDEAHADLKSIMGVMSLGVYANKIITIKALGIDAYEALENISKLIHEQKLGKEIE